MSNVGRAISDAFEFVSKVGQECEALGLLLQQEISDLFRQPSLAEVYTPDQWSRNKQTEESGWVFTGVAWSLGLKRNDKEDVSTYLSFQMVFLCDNPEGGMSSEPLLHINLWNEPINFKDGNYMGFEMGGFTDACFARLKDGNARLFRWEGHDRSTDQWTYSLRLADVNGLDNLRTLIRSPVERLLINPDAGEEALEQLDKVVVYSSEGMDPDYYRVI